MRCFFSAFCPAMLLCPRFWMNWASICLMNSQVSRSYVTLFFCHIALILNVFHQLPSVADLPSTGGSLSVAAGKKAEPQAAMADADADLEERLNNLRRD